MPLIPYSELVKIPVIEHCDTRKAKDDNGKPIDIKYLNWAKCKQLLHENGAESVYYTPLAAPNGSFVFCHYDVSKSSTKDGHTTERRTQCFFVKVEIHIDDKTFVMDYPLMNGTYVVYEDTLDQLRVSNAHARAFVKGVAIHTGLGFNLWSDDPDTDKAADDLSIHSLTSIKTRIEHLITSLMQKKGISQRELCDLIGMKENIFTSTMSAAFSNIALLEDKLKRL